MITSFPSNLSNSYLGGALKFFFLPVQDILFEPEIFNGKLIGQYTTQPEKNILTGLFDFENAKLDFTDASGTKGMLTKNVFSAFIAGNNKEYDQLFCEMRTNRFIVFIADVEKNLRVIGRKDNGAIFDFSFSTNKKRTDAPGFDFKFTHESSCCPPISDQELNIC